MKGTRASYEKNVEPFMALIKEMRHKGNTEGNIAKQLGLAQSTWYKYKTLHPELTRGMNQVNEVTINDVISKLSLAGFTSTQTVRKHVEVKGEIVNDTVEVIETITEYKRMNEVS